MKRYLFICLFLVGCCTPYVKTKTVVDNCNNVPNLWWGEKGDDPSETDLWKCYNWVLEAE